MAYKNSNSTSSISQEWGQWRYFNSAMKKLQTSTPTGLSIKPKSPIVKEEVDWMQTIGGLVEGAKGAYKAREELSYHLADEYMKTHSIEEYKKAMQDNSIPFQDDPIAMGRLKYNHGKLIFQLSEQDWENKVKNGDFVGKTPEELDALHYEHSKKSISEVSDVFGYANGGDYWFNSGFFEGAPEKRIKSLAENSVITDSRLREQDRMVTVAGCVANIRAGMITPEAFGEDFKVRLSSFSKGDLKNSTAFLDTVFKELGTSPRGGEYLDSLKGVYVDALGVTIGDYLGDLGVKAVRASSDNTRFNLNAKEYYKFKADLVPLAKNGQVKTLKLMLKDELERNGNIKTEKADLLSNAIVSAEKTLESGANAAVKKIAFDEASREFASYLSDSIEGNISEPYDTVKYRVEGKGLTDKHQKEIARNTMFMYFQQGEEGVRKVLSYVANKNNTDPEMGSYVTEFLGDQINSYKTDMSKIKNGEAVDTSNTPDFTYSVKGTGKSVTIKGVPESLQELLNFRSANPSAFDMVVGRSNPTLRKDLVNADLFIRCGVNPFIGLSNTKRYEKSFRDKTRSMGREKDPPRFTGRLFGGDEDIQMSTATSNQLTILAWSNAQALASVSDDVSLKDAYDGAVDQMKTSFIQVGTSAVPRYHFDAVFDKATPNEKLLADIDSVSDTVWKEKVKELSKKNYGADSTKMIDTSNTYYDPTTSEIVIVGSIGKIYGTINADEYAKEVRKRFSKNIMPKKQNIPNVNTPNIQLEDTE